MITFDLSREDRNISDIERPWDFDGWEKQFDGWFQC